MYNASSATAPVLRVHDGFGNVVVNDAVRTFILGNCFQETSGILAGTDRHARPPRCKMGPLVSAWLLFWCSWSVEVKARACSRHSSECYAAAETGTHLDVSGPYGRILAIVSVGW